MKWDERLSVQKRNEKLSDEIRAITRQFAGISACCLEKRITELCVACVPSHYMVFLRGYLDPLLCFI